MLRKTDYAYLCDTHTAVAVNVYEKYVEATGDKTPNIIASTASPYKFAADVLISIGEKVPENLKDVLVTLSNISKTEIPAPLANTLGMEIRFTEVLDPADMPAVPFRV